MKTLSTFENVRQQIADMDTMGFFSCNGVFGLEKRDDLAAAVVALEAERAALAEAADLVGKANMRLLEAQRQGDKTAIGNAMVDLYCELDRLAAVRAGSEVAK